MRAYLRDNLLENLATRQQWLEEVGENESLLYRSLRVATILEAALSDFRTFFIKDEAIATLLAEISERAGSLQQERNL
ncbi:MAG TPA: hypothetical protein VF458_05625 [Ktedonobacteraceae bacterium]